MKTKVPELFFNWTNPYTGECPARYSIQVDDPGSEHFGDLKSRRVISLLKSYGDESKDFPKQLMEEVYDDCCLAYFVRLATTKDSETLFTVRGDYVDDSTLQKICSMMGVRCCAKIDAYLGSAVESTPSEHFDRELKELHDQAVRAYKKAGDWILNLQSQEDLVKMTLILLNLRKDLWRDFPKSVRNSRHPLNDLLGIA